jgi:hypothetical protein
LQIRKLDFNWTNKAMLLIYKIIRQFTSSPGPFSLRRRGGLGTMTATVPLLQERDLG